MDEAKGSVLSDERITNLEGDCRQDAEAGKMSKLDLQIVLNLIATIRDRDKKIAELRGQIQAFIDWQKEAIEQHNLMLSALERIDAYKKGQALLYVQELQQIVRDTIAKLQKSPREQAHSGPDTSVASEQP